MGRQEDLPSKTDSLPVGDFGILELAGKAMFGEQWRRGIAKELKKHANFAGRVKGGQRLKPDDWEKLSTKVKWAFVKKAIELGNLRVAELAIQSQSQSTAADSAPRRRLARVQPAP